MSCDMYTSTDTYTDTKQKHHQMDVFTLDAVVFHQLCTINQHLRGDVIYGLALEKEGSNHVPSKVTVYNPVLLSLLPLAVSGKHELRTVCPHETWVWNKSMTCFKNEISLLLLDFFWQIKQDCKGTCKMYITKRTINSYQMSSGHPYFIRSSSKMQNISKWSQSSNRSLTKGDHLWHILSYLSFPM